MVPVHTTGGNAVTNPLTVQYEPQDLCLLTFPRAARLQRGTFCTCLDGDAHARQAEKKEHICGELQQRFRPQHSI